MHRDDTRFQINRLFIRQVCGGEKNFDGQLPTGYKELGG
jgi:hypothetical protein